MKTKNLAVGILAAVLTTALWWSFLLKPTRAQASKVKAATEEERAKLQPLQVQLAKARRDAAHAAAFKAQLESLQSAMPDSPALAAFIRDANGIAVASGVAWQSVTHATPVPGTAGVMSIAVGIVIRGTYPQVMDYLGRIAGLRRLVVVDSVQFNAAATTGANGQTSTGSTGPFTGASSLTVTIAARMFETPAAVAATSGGGVLTSGSPTPGASSGVPTSHAGSLNNS